MVPARVTSGCAYSARIARPSSTRLPSRRTTSGFDAVANGIVSALGILGDAATKPLVVRLDGNAVDEGRRILAEAAHPLVTVVATMDEAADKAAELASK